MATNINSKKKHMILKLADIEKDSKEIAQSMLDFKYKLDAIKRFILLRIDYELMGGVAPSNVLNNLDRLIRSLINKST